MIDYAQVTRFEVIDHRSTAPDPGRAFSAYDAAVAVLVQDDGQTLKVFLTDRAEES